MPTRFDDFTPVDCLDCQHYWTDACDSLAIGSQKPCTAFLATRSIDIPLQIKTLQKALKWLTGGVLILAAFQLAELVAKLINWMGG